MQWILLSNDSRICASRSYAIGINEIVLRYWWSFSIHQKIQLKFRFPQKNMDFVASIKKIATNWKSIEFSHERATLNWRDFFPMWTEPCAMRSTNYGYYKLIKLSESTSVRQNSNSLHAVWLLIDNKLPIYSGRCATRHRKTYANHSIYNWAKYPH